MCERNDEAPRSEPASRLPHFSRTSDAGEEDAPVTPRVIEGNGLATLIALLLFAICRTLGILLRMRPSKIVKPLLINGLRTALGMQSQASPECEVAG
jgi:hypothetical protein